MGLPALLLPSRCWACRESSGGAPLCEPCDRALPWSGPAAAPAGVVSLDVAMALDGPARALVHALKFRAATGLAPFMAAQMAQASGARTLDPPAALVPAPANPLRMRMRGYDHAALLADALGEISGRPVMRVLRRGGSPLARQRGRSRARRLATRAVEVRAAGPVPRVCVLVDDVHTTGATLAACAAALRSAGASEVRAITYAREL